MEDKDGKDRETSLDTIKQYASDIKRGDSDQNKKLAVAAADLEDKEGGEEDEVEEKPPMKIDKNPYDKKDDSDGDTQSQEDNEKEIKNEKEKDDNLVDTQLRLKKGDEQDKGGAGTPESRTGETVTVWGGKKVKELMEKGKSYEEAKRGSQTTIIRNIKKKNALLTKEWVESGLNCLDWIQENYGLDNIEEIAWDTPEGNDLIGSTGHGTSF